eukprot:2289477-Prymnesium_polylepis.1
MLLQAQRAQQHAMQRSLVQRKCIRRTGIAMGLPSPAPVTRENEDVKEADDEEDAKGEEEEEDNSPTPPPVRLSVQQIDN